MSNKKGTVRAVMHLALVVMCVGILGMKFSVTEAEDESYAAVYYNSVYAASEVVETASNSDTSVEDTAGTVQVKEETNPSPTPYVAPVLDAVKTAYTKRTNPPAENLQVDKDVAGVSTSSASSEVEPKLALSYTEGSEDVDTSDTQDVESTAPVEETIDTPYVELTDDEIYMLATLVKLEGGSESYECQEAIASVVINRMTTSGKSLKSVIYAKNQFTPAKKIKYSKPTDSTMKATLRVVNYGPSIPEWVTYFRANYYFNWGKRYKDYMHIDKTYFTYDTRLKSAVEAGEVGIGAKSDDSGDTE